MVFASHVINTRRFIGDPEGKKYKRDDIGVLFNEAIQYLQNETKIVKNITSLSTVENQKEYTFSTTLMEPTEIQVSSGGVWYKVEGKTLNDFRAFRLPTYSSRPLIYTLGATEKTIEVFPVPDDDAADTTLNGALTSSATSMTTDETTDFPDQGRVIIDSEVIGYTGTTSTTLTGLTRGLESTTAASHSDGATVTLRNIMIDGIRRFSDREYRTFYTTGTVALTNGDATVTGTGTAFSLNAEVGDYFGITSDVDKYDPVKWYEIDSIASATSLELDSTYAEATVAGSQTYIISDGNPFSSEYDGFIRAFCLSRALDLVGDREMSAKHWATAMHLLDNIKKRRSRSDVLIYPKGRHDYLTRKPMRGNLGSHYPI